MRLLTDKGTRIVIEDDGRGNETLRVENTHGIVEVMLPGWGTPEGVLNVQVLRAVCETVVSTTETSLRVHFDNDNCCGSHNTEVIR